MPAFSKKLRATAFVEALQVRTSKIFNCLTPIDFKNLFTRIYMPQLVGSKLDSLGLVYCFISPVV